MPETEAIEDRPEGPAAPRPQTPRGGRRMPGGAVRAVLAHPGRLALAVLIGFVAVAGWSWGQAMTRPGTDSLGARSVEWVRNHGGSGLVRFVEREWYSHHAPSAGGAPGRDRLPNRVPDGSYAAAPSSVGLAAPPAIRPIVATPAVAGEGRWTPVGRPVGGSPAVYVSFVRPDPAHTGVVASLAWMDTTLLRADLYAGYQVPGGRGWAPSAPVVPADGDLVAAFNSGFRLQDSVESGYYSRGRTAAPLVNGYGSLVIYADGRVTVGKWGRDVSYRPDIVSIRQNLPLIVDAGRPVPGLADDHFQRWGATLGNKLYVWRSGVGVTADGGLVYAAGADLSISTLASALAQAGAVRAMELDINTDWVDYFYFDPPAGSPASPTSAVKLIPAMVSSTKKYFEPSSKDFIAMFADPGGKADLSATPAGSR